MLSEFDWNNPATLIPFIAGCGLVLYAVKFWVIDTIVDMFKKKPNDKE